jgi:hypothetical protein
MVRSPRTRVLVLGFALALSAQTAWAEPRQTEDAPGAAWDLMAQLWHAAASWSDVGCWIDPGGACGAQAPAPPPESEIGCWIDPNGTCGAGR